ncbi:MAG: CoA pyrophosphatase [Paracoccaceae bacterium]|jgi:8-oxo-dGTP pyrophosphatase MutT (NUDIX family)|nr:CoA pyrophosphatase [Paracoccaceae bacterium]
MIDLKNIYERLSTINTSFTSDNDLMDCEAVKTENLIEAAVLIPIVERNDGLKVILTKRSNNLKQHPGQISFPGGKSEKTDKSLVATALRETKEEIGINDKNVEILGQLSQHVTITGFKITPFIGRIRMGFSTEIQTSEVSEIFEVPLSYLSNPRNFRVESVKWKGKKRFFYSIPYGPYYIWGATARILKNLADL